MTKRLLQSRNLGTLKTELHIDLLLLQYPKKKIYPLPIKQKAIEHLAFHYPKKEIYPHPLKLKALEYMTFRYPNHYQI